MLRPYEYYEYYEYYKYYEYYEYYEYPNNFPNANFISSLVVVAVPN